MELLCLIIFLNPIIYFLGKLKIITKINKNIFLLFSIVYNSLMGLFCWTMLIGCSAFILFANVFTIPFLILTVILVFSLLIPINIYIYKKMKINLIIYICINIIAFCIGLLFLWKKW